MYLVQLTSPAVLPVTVSEFADHLRLGSGFADDGAEDALLLTYLQSATAMLERMLSMAFAARSYQLTVSQWDRDGGVVLPVHPATSIEEVAILQGAAENILAADRYALVAGVPPRLVPLGSGLPALGEGQVARISFTAGFGSAAEAIPADLRQAVSLLAAKYYETRDGGELGASSLPATVAALIAPHRPIRL